MKTKKNEGVATQILMSILKIIWFIIKIPYFIIKGIYFLVIFFKRKTLGKKPRFVKSEKSIYEDFKLIKLEQGDYKKWINTTYKSDSQIGVILGARGSGKTAFGLKFLENMHSKSKRKCYAIGFHENEMPSWINVISEPSQIGNDSFVLIDEGGVLFSSRKSMTNANKLLSELILIARHKNLSILFISQNSSNLDINILRQADFLILKHSSLLQKEFERKIVQKIYDKISKNFDKLENHPGLSYVYSGDFKGFISNSLPSFWGSKVSKSFR
jgi:Cdc6-like AAA superfamily ATPase